MKKDFLLYYISRAVLSIGFAILVLGLTWQALLFALILFGLFVLYLHSGWFTVDPARPLTPLRRDAHGRDIQRKALLAAVVLGMLVYVASIRLASLTGFVLPVNAALSFAIITYFATQFVLFTRT